MLTWVEISKRALFDNIEAYRGITPHATIRAAVIKANAYGHSMLDVAKLLQENSSINYLCVFSLSEAVDLRAHKITKPILVLSVIDGDIDQALMHDISCVVYDQKYLEHIIKRAMLLGKKARIHFKIDTGLSRVGVCYKQAHEIIARAITQPCIILEGIFTHFANAESDDSYFFMRQLERFNDLLVVLNKSAVHIPYKHTTCSAAVTRTADSHYNFVRLGLGVYGLWPSQENKKITQSLYPDFFLTPVLTWKTTIVSVKIIDTGSYVGYDLTYQVQRQTRVGLLPIGYWDGYDRGLSNKGIVSIHGKKAPIIGRVAMNLSIIDITDIPEAIEGSHATLLGNNPENSAEALAHHLGTINYEITTRINPRITRLVVD